MVPLSTVTDSGDYGGTMVFSYTHLHITVVPAIAPYSCPNFFTHSFVVLLVVMSTYGGRTKPFPWIEVVRKQQQDVQLDNVVKVRGRGLAWVSRLQQENLIEMESCS